MLTQLSEKVFNSANPRHRGHRTSEPQPTEIPQSAYCFSIGSLLFVCSDNVPTVEAKPCLRTKQPLLHNLSNMTIFHLLHWDSQATGLPFAGIDLFSLCALLAFDVAAPAHLALAWPGHLPALSVVASPAADSFAVLILVALAGCRARRVLTGSTETGRVLNVEQVHSARDLIVQAGQGLRLLLLAPACGDLSLPRRLIGGAANLDGGLIALLQLLADLVEGQELSPAGLDGAGAGDAMAFASGLHSSLDYLVQRQSNTVNHHETLKECNESYVI